MSAKSLAKSLLPPLLASALRDSRDCAFGRDRRPRCEYIPEGWRSSRIQAVRKEPDPLGVDFSRSIRRSRTPNARHRCGPSASPRPGCLNSARVTA